MNPQAAQFQKLPSINSPVIFARRAAWDGLKLAHYRFRSGELPEHNSQEHLITLSLGGSCNGEFRTGSGSKARSQDRGNVCVVPAGQSYSARLEGESEHLVMFLDPSLVLRAAAESRMTPSRRVEVIESCATHDPVINTIGNALLSEVESERLGGRLYAESLANLLAVHLLRNYTTSVEQGRVVVGGMSGRKLQLVLRFIEANYDRDLSLAELSSAAGMSTFHFSREFKKTTGKTPHQYLIKFRIDRAKTLLSQSDMPLIEVGLRSGFSHQSHFTRLFHRLTGTTPQAFRVLYQTS
jgi:AraC family transcriptional regulator